MYCEVIHVEEIFQHGYAIMRKMVHLKAVTYVVRISLQSPNSFAITNPVVIA